VPRTRKSPTASKDAIPPAASATNGSGELVCPECDKSFTRPASLGAHRRRAHGVAGATKRPTRPTTTTRRSPAAPPQRRQSSVTRPASTGNHGTLSRDHLIAAIFPNGVPPKESVIKEISAWLDQAERLAKLG